MDVVRVAVLCFFLLRVMRTGVMPGSGRGWRDGKSTRMLWRREVRVVVPKGESEVEEEKRCGFGRGKSTIMYGTEKVCREIGPGV